MLVGRGYVECGGASYSQLFNKVCITNHRLPTVVEESVIWVVGNEVSKKGVVTSQSDLCWVVGCDGVR